MSRGITENEVFEAADALLARGDRPTIERVRQELGTGSPNTVNRHLDAWWAALSLRLRGKDRDDAVPAEVTELAKRIWEKASTQAQVAAQTMAATELNRLDQERRRLEDAQAQLERDRAGQAQALEVLRQQLDGLQALVIERDGRIRHLEEALQAAAAANAAMDAQNAKLQADLVQLRTVQAAEIERIQARAAGNEKQLMEKLVEAKNKNEQVAGSHKAELARMKGKLAAVSEELADAVKESARLARVLRDTEAKLIASTSAEVALRKAASRQDSIVNKLSGDIRAVLAQRKKEPVPGTKRRRA